MTGSFGWKVDGSSKCMDRLRSQWVISEDRVTKEGEWKEGKSLRMQLHACERQNTSDSNEPQLQQCGFAS